MHRLGKLVVGYFTGDNFRPDPNLLYMEYLRQEERREEERREEERREEERREKERREELHCNATVMSFMRDYLVRILSIGLSLFLWNSGIASLAVFGAFTSFYWMLILFRTHGLTAASSAAMVTVFTYIFIEIHGNYYTYTEDIIKRNTRTFGLLYRKTKYAFDSFLRVQWEQPRTFCTATCTVLLVFWLIGRKLETALIIYLICLCIFVGPEVLLRINIPSKPLSYKECDSEIEEFLPAVTEDNLQVLKRAGDTGDRSPTPPNQDVNHSQADQLLDEDLQGMRMPSHEEGSTDGLELSELELSTSETEIDGIRFQSGHFERGYSSSDDDVDIGLEAKTLDDDDVDDTDDSDFEIIDTCELANFKNV